jgi:penicillin-binding protein 1A
MTRLTHMTAAPRKTARKTPGKKRQAKPRAAGTKARGRKAKTKPEGRSLTLRVLRWAMVAGIWSVLALSAVLAWYAYDLPDLGKIAQITRRPGVTLLTADGTQFAALGDLYGETVSLRDLPAHLPQAVLAVEDRRFREHFGLDPLGLTRAMWVNLQAGRIVQGGSTITQQLAKILFLSPERTIKRKVQEMLLALWLERKFSKDQILALYLNRVYLGAGTYGVDAAARRYFDKPAAQVNLYEAALLAGLLKAPSRYNPARHAGRAEARTALVLAAMVADGAISAEDARQARSVKGRGRAVPGGQARYFADWVLSQVGDYIGQVDRDLVVVTTLEPKLQQIAEDELAGLLERDGVKRGVGQAAFVALTPRGAVRAMVGGRDYGKSQFNRAVQALRQPGSAFKPFVYLAALEQGSQPFDRMADAPVRVEGWSPRNYGERYFGEVTLREAFARSLNSVAVRLSERAGRDQVAAAARRLGITSDLEVTPSLALGASEVTLLELTGAFGVFANQGEGVWPYGIEEIREPDGRILYRRAGGGPGRVVAPRQVSQMTDLMTATVEWGTGKAAQPGRPAAGKTGTSQDFRDAWFIGYTADLVAGVWFGNDDGRAMKGVTGGSLPAVLWGRILRRALADLPPQALPRPAQVDDDAGAEPESFIDRLLRKLSAGSSSESSSPGVKRPAPER